MIIFRRVYSSDFPAIYQLAQTSGVGITTLSKDKKSLEERVTLAAASFDKVVKAPLNEYYLFVLEETQTQKIVGTAAIEAATGYATPFYSYKLSQLTQISHALDMRYDHKTLNLVNDYQRCSELCTLFLEPAFRANYNGLLLSRARFLFMANMPLRFSPTVIAEMRGVSDEEGRAPFWEHVGRHFFNLSFQEADKLTLATNKQFIADLMPKEPIYVNLLAQEAQDVIGKPHALTLPAMTILLREGFRYTGYVDIFDAGPTLEADFDQIKTINSSKSYSVKVVDTSFEGPTFLLASTQLDFRAVMGPVVIDASRKSCTIDKQTAELLRVEPGHIIRICPLHTDYR